MRNFIRTFWRSKCHEKNIGAFSGDCSHVEQLLTAAFDGEATDEALSQARRHIAGCAYCAQCWVEWEQTRVHLRSVPVQAVPASLLTRILLACRLMHSSDSSVLSNGSTYTKLVQYLEAIDDESKIASLSHIMTPVAVPSDLQRRILQATCEAPSARNAFAFLSDWIPAGLTSRNALRWGMGLAVPATAIWFIVGGQVEDSTQLAQSLPVHDEVSKNVASPGKRGKIPAITANTKPILKPLVKQVAAKVLPRVAAVAATSKQVSSDEDRPVVRRAAATTFTPDFQRQQPKAITVATRQDTIRVTPRRVKLRTRPATNLIENRSSRFVLASSKRPIARLPLQTKPQISHPPVATAPRFARMSESDFDEAFIAVAAARDNRPAEFSVAFDEYRAALLSDNVDTEEIVEDL